MSELADILSKQRIVLTGGGGFLGSAVRRALLELGLAEEQVLVARSRDYDLTTRDAARRLMRESFQRHGPTLVVHCAGAVGGIQANKDQPGRFFFDNMAMALNLTEEFRLAGRIEQSAAFVQVGSMTSYPASAAVPFREEDLWGGYPDAASSAYAVAKLAAWEMLGAYRKQYGLKSAYVIPVNLYGPGDNIDDVRNAHVAGSLIKRFVDAQIAGAPELVCWGSGTPTREFLYVDDAAHGVLLAAARALALPNEREDGEPLAINLGSGEEVSIRRLAALIARETGYAGEIRWDTSKPDGQARRQLDCTRAWKLLGFKARTPIQVGLARTVAWYRQRRLDAESAPRSGAQARPE